MIEIAALATTLVGSILVPFLKQGAESLVKKLTDQATDATASGLVKKAGTIWEKIRGKVAGTENEAIVDLFAKQPEMLQRSMQDVLKQLLETDQPFYQELANLVESADGGAEQWQLMGHNVGVVRANAIHGGNVAGVMIGMPREGSSPDAKAASDSDPRS